MHAYARTGIIKLNNTGFGALYVMPPVRIVKDQRTDKLVIRDMPRLVVGRIRFINRDCATDSFSGAIME